MDYSRYFWQGEKVRLRPLSSEDTDSSYENMLDTPSRQALQLGTELPRSKVGLKEFLEMYSDCKDVDGIIIFGIDTLKGEDVGGISFHTRHRKNGTFSFGLNIYRPYWKKGFAEDAGRILLRYAFNERNYQKCNSACILDHEASVILHKKLGLIEEGRRKRMFYYDGNYHDEILFGMTKEEFNENDKGYLE